MVFQSILLSLLIPFSNTIATSTVVNIKSWISPIHAQTEDSSVNEDSSIFLNNILVNNQSVELDEEDKIFVKPDDAVRVSGNASSNTPITVYFADKEKSSTTNAFGSWFVLFSITNMEEGQYILTAKETDSKKESVNLMTFVVGDGQETVEPLLDTKFKGVGDFFESLPIYLLLLILIPIAIVLGWVLRISFEKTGKNETRNELGKQE